MKGDIKRLIDEWFLQADYDFDTARAMFEADKLIYSIFMCHLSIEKALKGLYLKKFNEKPTRTHDLVYLSVELRLDLKKDQQEFLDKLHDLSVPTRYPDDLKSILKHYKKSGVREVLTQTKDLLLWLKEKLKET